MIWVTTHQFSRCFSLLHKRLSKLDDLLSCSWAPFSGPPSLVASCPNSTLDCAVAEPGLMLHRPQALQSRGVQGGQIRWSRCCQGQLGSGVAASSGWRLAWRHWTVPRWGRRAAIHPSWWGPCHGICEEALYLLESGVRAASASMASVHATSTSEARCARGFFRFSTFPSRFVLTRCLYKKPKKAAGNRRDGMGGNSTLY